MLITVTAEDARLAVPCHEGSCLMAVALRRVLDIQNVRVTSKFYYLNGMPFENTDELNAFVDAFDCQDEIIYPFTLELDVGPFQRDNYEAAPAIGQAG